VPAPAAHLLSNHYNQARSEYYRQLDFASKPGGDILPFVMYAVNGLVDQLRSQLSVIRNMQLDATWPKLRSRNVSRQSGRNARPQKTPGTQSLANESTRPLVKIAEVSPRLANTYARRTRTTVLRDGNALVKMDLLLKESGGYRAKKEIISAFLPERVKNVP
jgi:hypothetical protein